MINVWYSQENNVSIIQIIRLDKEKENTAKKMIILGMPHDFLILSNILFICDFFIPIHLENVIDATLYETMII